jgi:hypothetical protein
MNTPSTNRTYSMLCWVGSSHGVSVEVILETIFWYQSTVKHILPTKRVNKMIPIPQRSTGAAAYGLSLFSCVSSGF